MIQALSSLLDSIADLIFADMLAELTNTVSEAKIQITLLIVRQGALVTNACRIVPLDFHIES